VIIFGGSGSLFNSLLSTQRKIARLHNSLSDIEQTFGSKCSSMILVFVDGSMFLSTAIDDAQLDSEG
jgi:hypothetical protein